MARVDLTGDVLGDGDQAAGEPLPELPAPSKYTLLLGQRDEQRARDVVDDVVRRSGVPARRKQWRADVIRALFALAEQDEDLRARAAARIRAAELRRRDPDG